MRTWLLRVYGDLAAGRIGPADHPAVRAAVDAVHVLVVLARETVRDRLHVRAAHLAYWTAVAIVPILMLGFALTGPLGLADSSRESVRQLLYDTILAGSVEEVGGLLDDLLEHTHLGTLGTIGVLSTMFVGSQLFFNAELAYNDIFRARVERSWILRFTLFYAVITLGPVLLASGFILSARLGADGRAWPLFGRLLPLLISAPMFVTALRLLPCARVSWRAALTGGLVTALLFEGAKLGFGVYLDVFGTRDSLAVIYGSVAFLPVFLLWTYVLWLVVLFGVEVAWLVQHHGSLLDAQRRLAVDPHAATRTADAFFALAVMRAVGEHFDAGRGPARATGLAESAGLDPRHVQEALDVLISEGLLLHVDGGGVLPRCPPAELPPSAVLAAWRRRTAPALDGPAGEAVAAALAAVDASLRAPAPPDRAPRARPG